MWWNGPLIQTRACHQDRHISSCHIWKQYCKLLCPSVRNTHLYDDPRTLNISAAPVTAEPDPHKYFWPSPRATMHACIRRYVLTHENFSPRLCILLCHAFQIQCLICHFVCEHSADASVSVNWSDTATSDLVSFLFIVITKICNIQCTDIEWHDIRIPVYLLGETTYTLIYLVYCMRISPVKYSALHHSIVYSGLDLTCPCTTKKI